MERARGAGEREEVEEHALGGVGLLGGRRAHVVERRRAVDPAQPQRVDGALAVVRERERPRRAAGGGEAVADVDDARGG